MQCRCLILLGALILCSSSLAEERELEVLLKGELPTELAPHGTGNVYAPDILYIDGKYMMWYGGQGKDGHDRIHLAESTDGIHWTRKGVVLDNLKSNHVNDPSVVLVNGVYYMYYTQADTAEMDQIHVATSKDGIKWERHGIVIPVGNKGDWDSHIVGRPSTLYDADTKTFHLYYDGRSEGPRSVGHAESKDGIHWKKTPATPIFGQNAGGIDAHRVGDKFVMLYEGRDGIFLATSNDGLDWTDHGLWIPITKSKADAFGHVTPFLLVDETGNPSAVYFGAAGRTTWDGNAISRIMIDEELRKKLEEALASH